MVMMKRFAGAAAMVLALSGTAAVSGEFRATSRMQLVDLRHVATSAVGVEDVVTSALHGKIQSETTPMLNGAGVVFYATSIVPEEGKAHVHGYSVFRTEDGSVLNVYWEGEPSKWREDKTGVGRWTVLSGTGALAGATGSGDYTFKSEEGGPVQRFTGDLTIATN